MNNYPLKHILVIENKQERQLFCLKQQPFYIGRHSSNTLIIKSRYISRYHATIIPVKLEQNQVYSFWIIDGNLKNNNVSTNGFTVNNESCLMHELQPEDLIMFPDSTQLIYKTENQLRNEQAMPDNCPLKPLGGNDSYFKLNTEISNYFKLERRIKVDNLTMLNFLLDKEIELAKTKNTNLSVIFFLYNLNKLKKINENYQVLLRMYQLVISQQIFCPSDFVISFNSFEIAVLHDSDQEKVKRIANQIIIAIDTINEKLKMINEHDIVLGAYSQIPQNRLNIEDIIKQAYYKLVEKSQENDSYLFLNLNLLGLS